MLEAIQKVIEILEAVGIRVKVGRLYDPNFGFRPRVILTFLNVSWGKNDEIKKEGE